MSAYGWVVVGAGMGKIQFSLDRDLSLGIAVKAKVPCMAGL